MSPVTCNVGSASGESTRVDEGEAGTSMTESSDLPRAAEPTSSEFPQPASSGLPPAGWYPDPSGSGYSSWWDGSRWAPPPAPAPQPRYGQPQYGQPQLPQVSYPQPQYLVHPQVTLVAPKSVGVAFLLAFLFGPLGLLYASVSGGIVMIFVMFVAALLSVVTFGLPMFLGWFACMVWACVAANGHNDRIRNGYR